MLCDERTVSFAEAAKIIGRATGTRPHVATLWRWGARGVKGVRLEVLRLGRRTITSIEAIDRFGRALAELDAPDAPDRPHPERKATSKQRAASIEAANQTLREAGILE